MNILLFKLKSEYVTHVCVPVWIGYEMIIFKCVDKEYTIIDPFGGL